MRIRLLAVAVVLSTLLALTFSQTGYAGGCGGNSWYWAGGFLGGLFLGTALNSPYYAPRPVYVYPPPPVVYSPSPPVYVYPAPRYGSAYPEPTYSAPPQTAQQDSDAPKGEWIRVPGQWVRGRWVPEHDAFVPFNP